MTMSSNLTSGSNNARVTTSNSAPSLDSTASLVPKLAVSSSGSKSPISRLHRPCCCCAELWGFPMAPLGWFSSPVDSGMALRADGDRDNPSTLCDPSVRPEEST